MEFVELIEIACECQLTNAEKEFVRSDGLQELHFLWAAMVASINQNTNINA